jgi:hypothetical protein
MGGFHEFPVNMSSGDKQNLVLTALSKSFVSFLTILFRRTFARMPSPILCNPLKMQGISRN